MWNAMFLTWKSMWHRKFATWLTIFSIATSVGLFIMVQQVRVGAKNSFENTISGIDVIVTAPASPIQALLFSVFRLGNPMRNIGYDSYQEITKRKEVKFALPISLGDSHRGYKVVGTNLDYFKYFRFGEDRKLEFEVGKPFTETKLDVVLGSDVAKKFNYQLGSKIVLSHGTSEVSFQKHDKNPFIVSGILKPTGTPVDKSLHISLQGIEAIHIGWEDGAPPEAGEKQIDDKVLQELKPVTITSALIGLHSPFDLFKFQRFVNEYDEEGLTGILPGSAFSELWSIVSVVDSALLLTTLCVALAGLLGLITAAMLALEGRKREFAILRSIGCRPSGIFSMIMIETSFIGIFGCLVGFGIALLLLELGKPLLIRKTGLILHFDYLQLESVFFFLFVWITSALGGVYPGILAAYRSYSKGIASN